MAFRTPSGSVSAEGRLKAQKQGETMKGGSFPIRNASDLSNAKHDVGRAKNPAAARRWIDKRAKELGEPGLGKKRGGKIDGEAHKPHHGHAMRKR